MDERLPELATHVLLRSPQITAQVAPTAHKGQPPKFSPPKSESPIIPNPWKAFRSQKPGIDSDLAKRPQVKGPPPVVRRRALGSSVRHTIDLPDLPGQGDDVRGLPDELERRRPVQSVNDDGEGAVVVGLDQRAGVRLRGRPREGIVPDALREGVQRITRAEFHAD